MVDFNKKQRDECPNCGCNETTYESWHCDLGIEEYIYKCKDCDNVKEHWSYGYHLTFDWFDARDFDSQEESI